MPTPTPTTEAPTAAPTAVPTTDIPTPAPSIFTATIPPTGLWSDPGYVPKKCRSVEKKKSFFFVQKICGFPLYGVMCGHPCPAASPTLGHGSLGPRSMTPPCQPCVWFFFQAVQWVSGRLGGGRHHLGWPRRLLRRSCMFVDARPSAGCIEHCPELHTVRHRDFVRPFLFLLSLSLSVCAEEPSFLAAQRNLPSLAVQREDLS